MTTPFERSRVVNEMLQGYRRAQVLIAFAALGVGDALRSGPATAEDLASEVDADPAALARLLNAAALLGFVERDGDRFRPTPLTADVLTSDGQASLVNFVRREAAFYRRWGRLTEAVRTGQRPEASESDERESDWVRGFTLALYDTAKIAAPGIVEALAPLLDRLGRPIRLIDIGGGHGGYSIALARRYPNLEAVVFDLPPVIAVTREIVAATDVSDRVATVAGDFQADPLGQGFDVALLFGVLVGEDAERSRRLLQTVREALRPGGLAIVRSHHAGRHGDANLSGALFDLQMLLSTQGGGAHEREDTEEWMRAAGFTVLPPIDVPPPATGRLLVGRAPSGDRKASAG
ncbi:MAG TPA: methyltransferase [Thermomicrobiaceae bacterium]|nr:methyltransferase [Thermomicrobiaceae bacterium]